MASIDPDELLTPGQALTLLTPVISRRTLHRYGTTGRLRSTVLPSGVRRYRRRDVLALIGRTVSDV